MSYAPRKTHETPVSTIDESTGEITSDSLAAESLKSGGQFASGHAYISGQKSTGSTAANTDTSNATTLGPAPDAEARLAAEEWSESASLNASRSLNETKGEYKTGRGTGSAHTIGEAPSSMGRDVSSGERPKGNNLTEGGFDEGASNASYAEIGSERDPSRLTELEYERRNAEGVNSEGSMGPRVGGVTDKGQYGQLDTEADA